jgi:hypothetical protein
VLTEDKYISQAEIEYSLPSVYGGDGNNQDDERILIFFNY